jgi:thymidylate synthase (FAD)
MGTDLTVVNAARVSFSKESSLEDGVLKASDAKLVKYLSTHNHWTPFSHAMITMRETVPIFVARQRFKHMVGFTYNEESRRYIDSDPTFFMPDEWRGKAENKKQGSSDETLADLSIDLFLLGTTSITAQVQHHFDQSEKLYKQMLTDGVAPEQARMVLPQAMYTSYYVTGSLAAWHRAYKLRIDAHAQKEIQDLAKQWAAIAEPLFPNCWSNL